MFQIAAFIHTNSQKLHGRKNEEYFQSVDPYRYTPSAAKEELDKFSHRTYTGFQTFWGCPNDFEEDGFNTTLAALVSFTDKLLSKQTNEKGSTL